MKFYYKCDCYYYSLVFLIKLLRDLKNYVNRKSYFCTVLIKLYKISFIFYNSLILLVLSIFKNHAH